jgi:hypothetical protein
MVCCATAGWVLTAGWITGFMEDFTIIVSNVGDSVALQSSPRRWARACFCIICCAVRPTLGPEVALGVEPLLPRRIVLPVSKSIIYILYNKKIT